MKNKMTIYIIGLLIIVGAYVLLTNNKTTDTEVDRASETINQVDVDASDANNQAENDKSGAQDNASDMAEGEVKEFVIDGTNFEFSLKEIQVSKGDRVRIVFRNQGGFHDLKIDEFNVATQQISQGQQDVIEFVADKTGEFEYYCSVGTHRQLGMVGRLIVK